MEGRSRWRLPIEVNALGYGRVEKPVEVELQLHELGGPGFPVDVGLVVRGVVEVDRTGRVIDPAVPFQYDFAGEGGGGGRSAGLAGTLTFCMAGYTEPNAVRRFHALLESADAGDATQDRPSDRDSKGTQHGGVPVGDAAVRVEEWDEYAGQASLRITTPNAIYWYHRFGGGFASLIDREGREWIAYHPPRTHGGPDDPLVKGAGSANQFRGIPNTAFPHPSFHPGSLGATTRVVSPGPLKASLVTTSLDGEWEAQWSIYPTYATCTMVTHARPYWFLYEGTPGGRFDTRTGFVVRNPGIRTSLADPWEEALPHPAWVYFGDAAARHSLFLVQHEPDEHVDCYWPMNDEMTVFGFGRAGLSKPGTHAYIDTTPTRFTIGFAEGHDVHRVEAAIYSAHRPMEVRVGQMARDRTQQI